MNFLSPPWNGNQLAGIINQLPQQSSFLSMAWIPVHPIEKSSLYGPGVRIFAITPTQVTQPPNSGHVAARRSMISPYSSGMILARCRCGLTSPYCMLLEREILSTRRAICWLASARRMLPLSYMDGGHFVPKYTHTTAKIVRMIDALVGRVQHWC